MDEQMLAQIARENVLDFGEVNAKFEAYTDLKIKWARSNGWIEFYVCDYLQNAPIEVVCQLFRTLSERMKGNDAQYPESVCDYLQSEAFRAEGEDCNLAKRMKRMKNRYADLDYDVDSKVNERIYDTLFDLEEKGYKVAPVSVGTTSNDIGTNPWCISLLFKEVILNRSFVDELSDAELEAVLKTCLDVIHVDFQDASKSERPDVHEMILGHMDGSEARAHLEEALDKYAAWRWH